MDKNRNEMSDRILNLTLEIICLLTGEECKVVKQSGELIAHIGKVHTLGSPARDQNVVMERNGDQTIVELAKIVHPLNGEVSPQHDDIVVSLSVEKLNCVEPPKDPRKNRMVENRQPPRFLDTSETRSTDGGFQTSASLQDYITKDENRINCSTESAFSTPYSIETTNCVKRATIDCMSSPEGKAHTSSPVKKESVSYDGGHLVYSDIYTPTNHTQYTSTHIKEESVSCDGGDLTDTDNYTPTYHTQYTAIHIKEESVSCDEGDLTDTDIDTPTYHTQDTSIYSKDESERNVDRSVYTSTSHIEAEYTSSHIMEKSVLGKEAIFMDPNFYTPTDHTQDSSSRIKNQSLCKEGTLYSHTEEAQTQFSPPHVERHIIGPDNTLVTNISSYLPSTDYANNLTNKSDSIDHQTHLMNLNMQQKIHKVNKLTCLECGKCFKRNAHLKVHQRTHTGEKPFSCDECGKSFTRRPKLVIHQRIHRGEKPFACSHCEKSFTSSSNLVIHLRTHTGEKPYSCAYCGKSFTRKSQLNIHQRIHTGEKPYSCLECGKYFTQYAQLVTHQMIHTGEKLFPCFQCGKHFTTNSSRVRHQQTHERENRFSCSECGKCFEDKNSLDFHLRLHEMGTNDCILLE